MKRLLSYSSYIFLAIAAFGISSSVEASTVRLSPGQGTFEQGQRFVVEIVLDTQGESINAGHIGLQFSNDILEVEDFIS
ncbi:MAG: hypothetical protein HYT50_02625, partial [Candidatus Wildermuthbacteria bacterium]|nr:hypothetical protein [Candidatus Wildermuthbacteria bacterium]